MAWKYYKSQGDPTFCTLKTAKMAHFETKASGHHVPEWMWSTEFVPPDWGHSTQQWWNLPPTSKEEERLTNYPTGGRPWCHLHGAGRCMQNGRAVKSGRLSPRFQKKYWETKNSASERAVREAMSVKSNLQYRPQSVGQTRNMDCLRKDTRKEKNWPKRERSHKSYNHWKYHKDGYPKAFGVHILARIAPDIGNGSMRYHVFPVGL